GRMLFVARLGDRIVGTAQVVPANMPNQPHRADISKMLVHRAARRQGLGGKLMTAAEDYARSIDRTVLVLDTAEAMTLSGCTSVMVGRWSVLCQILRFGQTAV
ncbi:MAG: GNAT family N-acetyltransferase, partial [Pseudomonadota bacterium]